MAARARARRLLAGALAALTCALVSGSLAASASAETTPPKPTAAQCAAVRAHRSLPPILALDAQPHTPRVFAMQYKEDVANVVSYDSFRTKIECMILEDVLPYRAKRRPNVVSFNEDVGLATLATGTRGATARELFGGRGSAGCEGQAAPCGALAALGSITAAYSPQLAAYQSRFATTASPSEAFLAATDTIVRSFMGTFSLMAKRYKIYIIGSTDVAPFTQSSDATDVKTFADPDLADVTSVYVASSPNIYNEVFMWGPRDKRATGPDVLRNLVASNLKVPLVPLEQELGFTAGPSTGSEAIANVKPYHLPNTPARLGFATSLPAFVYGEPPAGTDPCSNTSAYYMRCLSKLGANVVIQDEANIGGRWTGADGDGVEQWQPLSWMASTDRAVSDPTVAFSYNVDAMMVGNLADLDSDGQSAITQRGGLAGAGCHYVGNGEFTPGEDEARFAQYAGAKTSFLALAPWVAPDASRSSLREVGAKLAAGSKDALENDYVETALVADLPLPADATRPACATAQPPPLQLP
jgi:hypothetical protein